MECRVGQVPQWLLQDLPNTALGDIWREHPRLVEIRGGLPSRLDGACSRCMMRRMCLGVCRVHAYVMAGNVFAGYWFCEEAEREGFFPVSRLIEHKACHHGR